MHRVVPELIIENYRAGCYRGEFPAVGMFLDLSGFSIMTDVLMQHGQHGAEVLASLMHGVFDPLVESIFDYGGKIVGFAGDGIMALYPIEVDARSTALRALASAFLVQQRLEENPARQTVYGKFSVSAKIGLAMGSVSWGILLSRDGEDATYYFRGSAVDESALAEHYASAGEILLADRMKDLLQGQITTIPFTSFHRFRGFRGGMPDTTRVIFPPIDLDISRRFMPEEVIAQDVRGEFRQIVNLFMRFPDLPDATLQELMAIVFELRKKYGGLITRLDFGDKGCNMLMLWGAPVAYENDIGRALNFVLDLKSNVDFPITAGVTYYIAHAGYLGSVMYEDYTCYGWGVNLASRFMMSAPTGQIWVDDRIARRVSKRFDIELTGIQPFKGFAAQQKVHLLRGYKPAAEVIYQGELVGREQELEQLASITEPLWQLHTFAGLTLVSGDAGIGKGRLVHEFRFSHRFEKEETLWAVCQSDQILRQSFNPLRSWLLRYFDVSFHKSLDERRQAFDSKLDDLLASIPEPELARELERTRSILAALVDVYWPESLYEQLDAEARYNNTFLALIALLKAESLRQPVILFLEDLQFTDVDTKDFLPRLKRAILAAGGTYPIAIIVTSRPHGATLAADLIDARIDLPRLSPSAMARLAENLLGGVPAPELVTILFHLSEGNPYFAEQILRFLQDENLLEMSRDGWALVRKLRDNILPGDVSAVLIARLDQLTRKVKESIQTASVLGREFEIQVLLQMLREEEDAREHIAEAERAAIWAPLNEMSYIFSHGLLRDAAYSMQMRARRRDLHALAVDALENVYAENLRSRYAELAYHAEHAELRQKAQQYYTLAGKASSALYQNSQAIDYFTRALGFTPFDDLATQFDLLVERVELFNRLGDRTSQSKDLEALEKLALQLDDLRRMAKVEVLFAHYFITIADFPAVLQSVERVMKLCHTVEDADITLDAYRVWPLALLRLGRLEEAMTVGQEGRRLAHLSNKPVKEGYILSAMGLVAIEQNDLTVAHEYLESAVSIARETGDRRLESLVLGNLGNSAGIIQQDYVSAREYYEAGYVLIHEHGERSSECAMLGNLGWVSGLMGDFISARSYLEQSLTVSREVGNPYVETNALINLSAAAGAMNDAQASLLYARKALEVCHKTGDRSSEAWSLLYGGYAHLLLRDFQHAEESFRHSMAIRDELGQPSLKMEPLAGLIQTLLLNGNHVAARIETQKILSDLEQGGTLDGTEEPLRVYYACYLALETLQDPRSRDVLRAAAQLLKVQVAKLRDEGTRQTFVENVPWRRSIQQAWRDQSE